MAGLIHTDSTYAGLVRLRPQGGGDADGMDGVTIDDVLAIINYILGREVPDTFDRDAADVNADGSVTMTDAALLIGRIVNPQ